MAATNGSADLRSVVMEIAAEVFEIDTADLREDQHLERDLGTTSVMRLDFLVELERRLSIQYDPGEAEQVMILGDIVDLTRHYVDRKNAAS